MSRAADRNIHFKTLEDFDPDYKGDWCPEFSLYCKNFSFPTGIKTNFVSKGLSKLTNVLMIKGLQKRMLDLPLSDPSANPIVCIAVHPGFINTFSHQLPRKSLVTQIINLFFSSPEVGSYNSTFAAASPLVRKETEKYQGRYLVPVGNFEAESENVKREELLTEFWDNTVRILKECEESGTFGRTTVRNVKLSEGVQGALVSHLGSVFFFQLFTLA